LKILSITAIAGVTFPLHYDMKGEIYTGTLDLIVTHYKEPWELGKPFFDVLALQRNIRFEDVGVILVNDGEENELPSWCFDGYPFEIHQMSIKHGGVSRARNAGLDASTADWVMFCDFDDSFSSLFGLHLIFAAMQEDSCDTLWSAFTEETVDSEGVIHLAAHERDFVFVHGKAHRRQFLVDNNIRFHDKLTIHEDAFFNVLVQKIAGEDRIAAIKTPIYVWKWNKNSVVRKDESEDFVLDTYDHLMRQKIALTEEFIKRERAEDMMELVVKTVVDVYYDCQNPNWRLPKNKEKLYKVENWFAAYLKRYANIYTQADAHVIAGMAKAIRDDRLKQGRFLMEFETIGDWLKHIMDTSKPIPLQWQNV